MNEKEKEEEEEKKKSIIMYDFFIFYSFDILLFSKILTRSNHNLTYPSLSSIGDNHDSGNRTNSDQ